MKVPDVWNLAFQLLPQLPQQAKDAAAVIDCLASLVIFRIEMGGYGPSVASDDLVETPEVVELHPHEAFAS